MKNWLSLFLICLWTGLGLVFVFYGAYAYDEGWYSLISREVWRGRMLYEDVRFTQMPLLPYLYGGVLSLLPPRIESARLISLALALGGVLLLWNVCRVRYGRTAALAGLIVLLVHKAFLAEIVTMRTQALSFAAAALVFMLSRIIRENIRGNAG